MLKKADTDPSVNTALDQQRLMYYSANWQLLEERVDDGSSFPTSLASALSATNHHVQCIWGLRYIDDLAVRRVDLDKDGDYGDDDVYYHCTDAQFSTVAVLDDTAKLIERVSYDPYGKARHHRFGDVDGDGGTGSADLSALFGGWGSVPNKGDLDRDGDVDSTDQMALLNDWGAALASGELSAVGNTVGWDGYVFNPELAALDGGVYTVRHRHYLVGIGRWGERDPSEFSDGQNLYQYLTSRPTFGIDPTGQVLEIIGPDAFQDAVQAALKQLCNEMGRKQKRKGAADVFVDKPQDGFDQTTQDRLRVRKAKNLAKQSGTECETEPDPECRKRPGCDLLQCLIDDDNIHTIRDSKNDEVDENIDSNGPRPGGDTETIWSREPRERKGFLHDYRPFEVLFHELVHACHTADGTRDWTETAPGQWGWEEVNTIEQTNNLMKWYNRCGKSHLSDPDILPRDPFSHGWSKGLRDKERPKLVPSP